MHGGPLSIRDVPRARGPSLGDHHLVRMPSPGQPHECMRWALSWGVAGGGEDTTHDLSRLPSRRGGLACLLRGDRDFPRLLTWVGEWALAGFRIWGR